MKLFYLEKSDWEYDLITKDFLNNIEIKIELFNNTNYKTIINQYDISDIIDNNILVVNNLINLNDIINIVIRIKPIVIFYLSDEYGNESNTTILEKYTKILFRQYNHKHYKYGKNNYQIPLGYSKFFLNSNPSNLINQKKIVERKINASFIGSIKSDRLHMTETFKQNMQNTNIQFVNNSWNIQMLPYSPEKCFEIYNDSIFVICGRGNCSLECFRIYEAIVAGAIPVIVGSNEEINTVFNFNNNIPPFIYDDSWEKVVIKCNELLNNYEKLQKIQYDLLLWWKNEILFINKLIVQEIK